MKIQVVRHGLSEANNRENIGTPAFGAFDAPLMPHGRIQASFAAGRLRGLFGVDIEDTPVAVSELLRTRQTAREMGFQALTQYELLNEVEHGKDLQDLRALLDANTLPDSVLRAAEQTLNTPPTETVWVSHGLRIAGMCALLGIYEDRLVPHLCEIRELDI